MYITYFITYNLLLPKIVVTFISRSLVPDFLAQLSIKHKEDISAGVLMKEQQTVDVICSMRSKPSAKSGMVNCQVIMVEGGG